MEQTGCDLILFGQKNRREALYSKGWKALRWLVALGAYEISEDIVTIHIVYMERQTQSNPTLCESPKHHGIGRVLIAYGIFLLFPSSKMYCNPTKIYNQKILRPLSKH